MCFSFRINQTSGEIQTSVPLDRETVNRHMLTVVAADNGSPESLSSEVEVLVLVEDVNDNPPVFVQKEYSLSLSLYTQPGLLLRVNVRHLLCDLEPFFEPASRHAHKVPLQMISVRINRAFKLRV